MSTAAVKKTKAPATHPKYIDMITTAIAGLKERTGCSRQAILKYIVANNKVEEGKAVVQVRLALKAGLAKGVLKHAKENGKGAGKFKIVKVEKKSVVKKPVAKKPVAKKPVAKKAVAAKPVAEKAKAKKSPEKKVAPKKKASPKKKPAPKKTAAKKAAKK